jgi:uncharacterized repeat protein (TIGR01451 family)
MIKRWLRGKNWAVEFPHFRGLVTLTLTLLISLFGHVLASPTPAGTNITNIANSSQVVGAATQSASTNAVTVVVGSLVAGTPMLSKSFVDASINSGASTGLTFTISNAAGNPAQAGIAFTDTLPSGLQLGVGATGAVSGAGCAGVVNLTAPGTISVVNLSMTSGTASCTVGVSPITNVAGQSNDTCAANPAAFTNASANISGLANLGNAVSPQCLQVKVLVLDSVVAKCINDTPYVDYTVHAVGVAAPSGVNIDWQKSSGQTAASLPAQPLSGRLLWPGAAVDAAGNPTAWPGWSFQNGQWVQINDGLRPNMTLVFSINPSASISVSYPPATPTCNANPPAIPVVDSAKLPKLTKAFGQASMVDGESTTLTFTLTAGDGAIGMSGIGFDDILPAGLMFKDNATVRAIGGCTGTPTFGSYAPPFQNIFSFRDGVMLDGEQTCTIVIDGVTNRAGMLNPDQCGAVNSADFTNGPTRISTLLKVVNNVTPQCLIVLPPQPSLTKSFADDKIADGDSTVLTFSVRNTTAAPAVTGISFTDNLPAGLRLSQGAVAQLQGAGCSGTVNLTSPGQIAVSNMQMGVGTKECLVLVNGVTNAEGQLNASCAGNPASFTNSAASMSGVAKVHNSVAASCLVVEKADPALQMTVVKSISKTEGYSPSGPYTVTLAFENKSTATSAAKRDIQIADALPAGMTLVPGSLRVQLGTGSVAASTSGKTVSAGAGSIGLRAINFDTSSSNVSVTISLLEPGDVGTVTFDVMIAPKIAKDTILSNTANFSFVNSKGVRVGPKATNTVTFRVLGNLGVRVVGQTIQSADPGAIVVFNNIITNLGDVTDTFNITLSGSNYPAGSIIRLLSDDGVSPLADSNRDGVPDTGPIDPGGSKVVIVQVTLPATQKASGPFKLTKTARSIRLGSVVDADNDVLLGVAQKCKVILESDNKGSVKPGGSIVYSHYLTNVGNCVETASAGGVASAWTAVAVSDNRTTGGQSVVGLPDPTDSAASNALTLNPGDSVTYLVTVTAPVNAANGAQNISTFSVTSTAAAASGNVSRTLSNVDTTTVSTTANNTASNGIQGYVDNRFQRPTVWAFIGGTVYLRADAQSCNQDPTVVEHRTIIITGPNGEREEIVATETGIDTGIFIASGIHVARPPVAAGDGVLEGNPNDIFDIEIVGCGRRISTTVTLIDPNGVVFNSRTNEPVANTTVRLVLAKNGQCTATLAPVSDLVDGKIVPSANPVTTKEDGRFPFPLVSAGQYCLIASPPNGYTWASKVTPENLPLSRLIVAPSPTVAAGGSYGGAFDVTEDNGPITVDIPVDPGIYNGLFVQKASLRSVVEVGEFTDYVVTVNNATGNVLNLADVFLTDTLPAGFSYQQGTARLDGKPLADPLGKGGPKLQFNIGPLDKNQQVKLTYRVRVGPGAMQGDGINRVQATYRPADPNALSTISNIATAQVAVNAGLFTNQAYVLGKVFADCNADGIQSEGELGVPGVRLYMEDGTSIVTDAEGKFSLYGLSPRTHVLKIDRTTLPAGIGPRDMLDFSNRNLGKGDSRIVDLKNGELQKVNFAIKTCSEPVIDEVNQRRLSAAALRSEVDGRLQQRLATDPNNRPNSDVKALPASGVLGQALAGTPPVDSAASASAPGAAVAPATAQATSGFRPLAPPASKKATSGATLIAEEEKPLEDILPEFTNELAFMGLKDGEILPYAQTNIRVKGREGVTFQLRVNGKEIPVTRVGKKAVLSDKQLQAWEYIGVDLNAGVNELTVTQTDQFGNVRGEKTLKVTAPGTLAKIAIEFPATSSGGVIADGKTPSKIIVKLVDDKNVPVTTRTAVTLEASLGRLDVEDLNAVEPGIQTFIQGGRAEFSILPPSEPGQGVIRVTSGAIKSEERIDFLPDLRDMIAAGVIEGVLNLRKLDTKALTPARAQDGFEQEIQHISRNWNDGKLQAGARAAMFLKGKIKGDYLLTLAYDSDKNTRDRLFRDIQPDDFYPVYGDSSIRAFDAQSTGRFYVRVDNKKSYLLYGDFNTTQSGEGRKLSNYNRSLSGIKEHFENSRVSANVFASRDSTRQIVDEFPANGTSGPFILSNIKGLINSEKVEILTRDRNQTSVVISSLPQTRFADYELEALTGRLLFKAPIASLDDKLNPVSIRVTYEIDQGGAEFWVGGAEAQFKVTDRFEVGGMVVEDRNPLDKFRMLGANSIAKLADKTFLIAEIAQTKRDTVTADGSSGATSGTAERIEIKHASGNIDGNLYVGKAGANFDNASSNLSKGRMEAGGKMSYKLSDKTRLSAELIHTEDTVAGAKRDGLMISGEQVLENGLRLELGLRHARDTQASSSAAAGTVVPTEVTSIRGRVSGDIPQVKNASAYGEVEVDVQDANRKVVALGGDYKLPNNGRLYARHEFISSLTGPYGLSSQQRQNSTVFGINTDYMKDGNVFSEYRVRDAISGGDAEAALGLRNTWTLREGLKLQTGFERVHALSGAGNSESTAATFGVEYTANPLWKGSTKLELRNGKTSDSVLSTVAVASKLNRDWTFLGRNTYALTKNKSEQGGENLQDRMQAGLAFRDTDSDVFNGLGRIEHRTEQDTTQPDLVLKRSVEMISLHGNWQPRRPFTFSARYAAKWTNEDSNGIKSRNNAQLLSGRATWDVAKRWDVSVYASNLMGNGTHSKYYGLGVELGFMVMENMWLSAGYNFFGFRDEDLAAGDYTNKGAFVRIRYKFDEDVFAPQSKRRASPDKQDTKIDDKPAASSAAVGTSAR